MLKSIKPYSRFENHTNITTDVRLMLMKLSDVHKEMLRITSYCNQSETFDTTKANELKEFTNKVYEYRIRFEKLSSMDDFVQENQTKIKEEITAIKQNVEQFMRDIKIGKMGDDVRQITILSPNEKRKIEEWSDKKIGQILFDSYIDDWSLNSSTFYKHVIGRNKLLFLIEDSETNRFGCYIHSKITEINQWIRDDYGFLFSLYDKGFDDEMKRYEIKDSFYSFKVYKNKEVALCSLGNEIFVNKCNYSKECYIDGLNEYSGRLKEWKINYDNYKEVFETKRFTVHQME